MPGGQTHLYKGTEGAGLHKHQIVYLMKLTLNHFIAFSALFSIGLIVYGFYIQEQEPSTANQYIGLGTVGLFLVAMPLFLVKESQGKNIKDYMLNQENIEKMKADMRKSKKNR